MAEFHITGSKVEQISGSGNNYKITGNKGTVAVAGQTATANDPAAILSAIQTILDHLPELPLPADDRATIEADAKAAAAQLASPTPKHGVVRQLLGDIVGKVKGTLSGDVAAQTVKVVESAAGVIAGYVQSAVA